MADFIIKHALFAASRVIVNSQRAADFVLRDVGYDQTMNRAGADSWRDHFLKKGFSVKIEDERLERAKRTRGQNDAYAKAVADVDHSDTHWESA